jgi:hypothetical protein
MDKINECSPGQDFPHQARDKLTKDLSIIGRLNLKGASKRSLNKFKKIMGNPNPILNG